MINIWEYANEDYLKVTTQDGNVYIGMLVDVIDKEEGEDGGYEDDELCIQIDSDTIMGFFPSEIKGIEIIDAAEWKADND